ncbi:hypothetical protein BC936DRAFT_142411 [Jimgerdemannia flammicorona]|uniref:Uncharacterized protein n=2 Tax=Jimgerdemannia flammicorona TaxID=994334 RepID=A0A433A0E3_9FUNG|nr:hypothetical protein BC936DRAFT_142411 [Jimgerdemannia flammicorona]RUS20074.1 hypothetical protein BC938DRAFT_475634 [Jimgerdemannia flammicorona]
MDLASHIDRIVNSLRLMTFTDQSPDTEASEPESVTRALAPFRNRQTVEQLVVPMLKTGLKKYYEVDENGDLETKVSVVVAYSFEVCMVMSLQFIGVAYYESRVRFAAHFSPLSAPLSGRVAVEVDGEPRKVAGAKDSQWVRDRLELEHTKSPTVNEVLLSDSATGNIYEGLSSNFFAIYRGDAGAGRSATVHTAPLEFVLQGTVMKAVLTVCERDDIPVQWQFPNIEDAREGKWEGSFVSSEYCVQ